ncbi:hypothetical protein GCM10016455_24080 [Aliiroseovarius zhejiangensis]|uniref:DUF1761 domain-containing protein n=1 Tax=Aliiroseovarius zhejiangensis TaxID=1632025 RepID=A0ABQ3J6M7_9RHOB|nr:DUF1761 domain-containing protein [Aliiroseovarius zhejiangensis]GHF02178.1 hypothetical protein GCM10016455_24080 [Aliiroseovarius zhejiangensis]
MLQVLISAIAGYAFGAVWYMVLAKKWVAATEIEVDENGKPVDTSPLPFIVAFISALVVAGMMRHIFVMAGIDTVGKGLTTGLGLGLFVAAPWIVNNVMFGERDKSLIWIDGGYAAGGCAVIGLVLALF